MNELHLLIDRQALEQRLAESGCCNRCIQRCAPFLKFVSRGDRSHDSKEPSPDVINDNGHVLNGDSKLNGNSSHSPCFVCLDLLSERQLRDLIDFIKNAMKVANYESPHFVLSLVTVQILEIRQILLALWLKEKFPVLPLMDFMDRCFPIKQLLKEDLVEQLPEATGLEYRTNSAFDVKVEIDAVDVSFFGILERLDPEMFVMVTRRQRRAKKTISQIFSRKSILAFFSKHSTESLKGEFPFPGGPIDSSENKSFETGNEAPFVPRVTLEHEPIFVGGRYNKYSRDLPQTPWILDDGVRLKESSIEEMIVDPIKELLRADDFKFSSSGREDVDVRCLGEGRPFVVECLNPRRVALTEEELRNLEAKINATGGDSVRVTKLAMVSDRETAYLRKMENEKRKHYGAECHSLQKLTANDMVKLKQVQELMIQQKTPIRYERCRIWIKGRGRASVLAMFGFEKILPYFLICVWVSCFHLFSTSE